MFQVEIEDASGARRCVEAADCCIVGRGAQNEVRLDGWRVSKEHARLFETPSGVLLEDMGAFAGVSVNGLRIDRQYGPLKDADVIGIGAFRLRIKEPIVGREMARALRREAQTDADAARSSVPGDGRDVSRTAEPAVLEERRFASAQPGALPNIESASAVADAALALAVGVERKQLEFEWRTRLHASLLETMDLRRQDVHSMSDERLRQATEVLLHQILRDAEPQIPRELDRQLLCRQVLDEAVGLGPLEELLADDSVSEIMVNRFDEIYVERLGRLQRHPLTFTGDRAVMGVIERIVAPLGRRIDESSPMVDARLKDGSRVNAIIPPLALRGPCLTIRKFARRKLGVQDLVEFGALTAAMAEFLEICVVSRKNIVVSGGTGAGKTTLLNILSNFIPMGERVITIEDAAELNLNHLHLISLESRPANVEGKGAIPIRELVRNTLRMRPDRIVVGECRGAEALDMLQAMNTGHEGSLTTLHANSGRDALARLETMVLMAGMDLPLTAIREQIASAVNIIVQQSRFACGTRMVTGITEVTGMESGKIQLQELFRFVNQGYAAPNGRVRGFFTGCDTVPGFYEELRSTGHQLDMAIFKPTLAAPGKAREFAA